ncbi:hypothetical protein [Nocardia arizonensis]|uniref:hypothetical protein n=1 Tax=Nocardia arizonensis TaxID=1141647 RepID=UPI000AC69FEC|nr:hypothetical protein [Nocardia arizonensis]
MTDMDVDKELLVGLGTELCRIGAAVKALDAHAPFHLGIDDLKWDGDGCGFGGGR